MEYQRDEHRVHLSVSHLIWCPKRPKPVLVAEGIGTLCIGKTPLWKQDAHMGKRTNQPVVSVPHAHFIAMLSYKAELVGIQVLVTEERYTGTASLLDADPLPVSGVSVADSPTFSGKRVKRDLYRAAGGRHSHAEANGAYNSMRKVAPDAFAHGSRGCGAHPIRLAV